MTATLILLLFLMMPITALADESSSDSGITGEMLSQMEEYGTGELAEEVPESAKESLGELGLEDFSPTKLLGMTPSEFFSLILKMLKEQVKKPLQVLMIVLGILILSSLIEGLKTAFSDKPLTTLFNVIAVMCIVFTIAPPIMECIQDAADAIRDCSNYITSFIPVFAGMMTVAGQTASAVTYNMILFSVIQVITKIASSNLVPLMGIYLAFCIIGAVSPQYHLSEIALSLKKVAVFVIGVMTTVFVSLLTIQGLVSASADTVATKTTKFIIGAVVPIVGSALSEALNSVKGCVGFLKTSVGAFSILVVAVDFLPVLLRNVAWMLTLNIASALAGVFDLKQVTEIFKSASFVFSILNAIILCFALIVIISTAMMMILSGSA